MVYWVIFAAYMQIACILHYIPFIWVVETIVAGWLVHPRTLGALYLHALVIDKKFAEIIEEKIAPKFKQILRF